MSESYTIVPLDQETREWLIREGHACVPQEDGRQATLRELKAALASVAGLSVEWSARGASLESAEGFQSELLIGDPICRDDDPCQFHFLDGSDEMIE